MLTLENRIKRDALKYERYKDQLSQIPNIELINFRLEVENAYLRIFTCAGYHTEDGFVNQSLSVRWDVGNPYENLEQLTKGIENDNFIKVSTDNNNSLLLPGDLNLKFRAIHDYLHYLYQKEFDFEGEFDVYKAQKLFHSTKIGRKILYSEIVLQAAYCSYFGHFSDKQKVIIF